HVRERTVIPGEADPPTRAPVEVDATFGLLHRLGSGLARFLGGVAVRVISVRVHRVPRREVRKRSVGREPLRRLAVSRAEAHVSLQQARRGSNGYLGDGMPVVLV